jgi:hypothetical protein
MSLKTKEIFKKNESIVKTYDKFKEFYYRHIISDEQLIRKRFKKRLGREVDLENPIKFNDKLQWLKLNWHDAIATKCADKYEVREIVKEKIGEEYLNEIIGVYESVDEINIDELPKKFVLKGTHGSGFNIICKDKSKMNWDEEFKKMRRWLRTNYYLQNREWVYKDIKPRIICEKYLTDGESQNSLIDYKFFCFNGEPTYCQVIRGRGENETIDFYDTEWNHMTFNGLRELPMSTTKYEKPKKYEKMIALAKELAGDFPFVRVDFYYVQDEIIFGELTFFPLSGMGKFTPDEWDFKLGELLKLPEKVRKS